LENSTERHRNTWDDGIKVNLSDTRLEDVNCFELADDTFKRRVLWTRKRTFGCYKSRKFPDWLYISETL